MAVVVAIHTADLFHIHVITDVFELTGYRTYLF